MSKFNAMKILKILGNLNAESLASLDEARDYMIIIADDKVVGALADPFDMPGIEVAIRAARETAAYMGHKRISFVICTSPLPAKKE